MSSLIISEIFGPTVQGEGPTAGRLCCFLRLSNCNLTCKWCDTPYTWDWSGLNGIKYRKEDEQSHISESEVLDYLITNNVPRLVISGGEPLMQGPNLISLCGQLTEHNIDVEIETNGTISPPASLIPFVSMFNCSPKLEHSGVIKKKRFKPEVLRTLDLTEKEQPKLGTGSMIIDEQLEKSNQVLPTVKSSGFVGDNLSPQTQPKSVENNSNSNSLIQTATVLGIFSIIGLTFIVVSKNLNK